MTLNHLAYRSHRKDGLQACVFCKEWNLGFSPRIPPRGVRKYRNRWLIARFHTCLRNRKAPDGKPTTLCIQDQGFVNTPRGLIAATLLLTLLLTLFWCSLIAVPVWSFLLK